MNKVHYKCGFSLAELMVVMLILTIVLAASMPILSKRARMKANASAGAFTLHTHNAGDHCDESTDTIAVANDNTLLVCMAEKTLGGSCDNTAEVGDKAVDITTMSGTDNPYVHLVCIKN